MTYRRRPGDLVKTECAAGGYDALNRQAASFMATAPPDASDAAVLSRLRVFCRRAGSG
jgi:hypothetical protein